MTPGVIGDEREWRAGGGDTAIPPPHRHTGPPGLLLPREALTVSLAAQMGGKGECPQTS